MSPAEFYATLAALVAASFLAYLFLRPRRSLTDEAERRRRRTTLRDATLICSFCGERISAEDAEGTVHRSVCIRRRSSSAAVVAALFLLVGQGCAGTRQVTAVDLRAIGCGAEVLAGATGSILSELFRQLGQTGRANDRSGWVAAARGLAPAYAPRAVECAIEYALAQVGTAIATAPSGGSASGPTASGGAPIGDTAFNGQPRSIGFVPPDTRREPSTLAPVRIYESYREAFRYLKEHPEEWARSRP